MSQRHDPYTPLPGQMLLDELIDMGPLPLTVGATHRHAHDTELTAALESASGNAVLRHHVLAVLLANPDGLTDDEGAEHLRRVLPGHRIDRLTFGRRRHELHTAGLVDKTPRRRSTPNGRPAIVWKALTA